MDSRDLSLITDQYVFSTVQSGDLDGLKHVIHLLKKEGSLNGLSVSDLMSLQNDAGETLLYIAAELNLCDVFSFLLKFCDLDVVKIRSKSDMNAFHVAAKRGHLGILIACVCDYGVLMSVKFSGMTY